MELEFSLSRLHFSRAKQFISTTGMSVVIHLYIETFSRDGISTPKPSQESNTQLFECPNLNHDWRERKAHPI
jgi:hypothetical protein